MIKILNPALKKILLAACVTLLIGSLIGALLFHYSDKFFDIKTLQTQVSGGFIGSEQSNKASQVLPRGTVTPDVSGVDIRTGELVKISEIKDSIVILNFWASWCEPCLDEFPSFATLLTELGPNVVFIGVSQDTDIEDATSFLKAFNTELDGLNTKFIHDNNKEFAKQYGVLALPETFILGPERKLIHRVSGFENWSSPQALDFFKQLKLKHLSKVGE